MHIMPSKILRNGFFVYLFLITFPEPLFAYIGPGAGFVFVSSFLIIFISIFLSFLSLLLFPFRVLFKFIKLRNKDIKKTNTGRVVVVGFDGMDPELTNLYLSKGLLSNFSKLKEKGNFSKLQTTLPPISPVAWSSFSTGSNPAKHNIFDFLAPNRKNYTSYLSSVKISGSNKHLNLGKYKFPLKKAKISILKKSKTFWKILGEHGIFSIILRVPITYPPEKFFGALISGMCVPDILGTQGTFTFYSSNSETHKEHIGGQQIQVEIKNNSIETYIPGPNHPFLKEPVQLRTKIKIFTENENKVKLRVGKKTHVLEINKYSDWVEIPYKILPGIKINGIAKFYLKSVSPEFKLYLTPVNINPERPSLPVGTPKVFPIYMSKIIGKFGTLGLMEDTWALNEGIIDEQAFWDQSVEFFKEVENMFFQSLKKVRKGALVCVFDLTDRTQHMFMRYLDSKHPANIGRDSDKYKNKILESYQLADNLIGKLNDELNDNDALIILSDHGFKQFQRGFNLNKWLLENGYLSLKDSSSESDEWFENVNWNKTKAYGIGLNGLYINQKGRESEGVVNTGNEKKKLLNELKNKLLEVIDEKTGKRIMREIYITDEVYKGPYKENAPDLLLGFYTGYRISWDSVTGKICGNIIVDNTRKWSGDHCIDPREVPGILFSNRKLKTEDPRIIDIAPSILELLGIRKPGYMDGQPIIQDKNADQ